MLALLLEPRDLLTRLLLLLFEVSQRLLEQDTLLLELLAQLEHLLRVCLLQCGHIGRSRSITWGVFLQTERELPARARDRVLLDIEQMTYAQQRLDVLASIHALARSRLLRREVIELPFPSNAVRRALAPANERPHQF